MFCKLQYLFPQNHLNTRNVIKQKEAGPINSPSHPDLKIGSFNVRGLDQETFWYVEQLVQDRDFDVRYFG